MSPSPLATEADEAHGGSEGGDDGCAELVVDGEAAEGIFFAPPPADDAEGEGEDLEVDGEVAADDEEGAS